MNDLAEILGASREARSNSGCICIHIAIADQMADESWNDNRIPDRMRIVEHRRRHQAILSRQMKCPAWDTCSDRIRAKRRRDNPAMATWEIAFGPRLKRGRKDQLALPSVNPIHQPPPKRQQKSQCIGIQIELTFT